MSDLCAEHRPYLAALADGELDLVPRSTLEHVEGCRECSAELGTHELLSRKLRAAAQSREPAAAFAAPGRRFFMPAAAAAALIVATIGVAIVTRSGPDPLASAVQVADRQPAYWSTSPGDLASWCSAQYGNRVPTVAVPGLEPVGARMDWLNGIGVATVTYTLAGKSVHVSWLNSSIGGSTPSKMSIDGHEAVVVRAHGITAVVSGAVSDSQLESIAREIAAGE